MIGLFESFCSRKPGKAPLPAGNVMKVRSGGNGSDREGSLSHGWPSKNRGIYPPKWMVKIMENLIKMDDLGVPLFLETPT